MPRLHDPAVSLTDAALGLEAAAFAARLWREPPTGSPRPRSAALRRAFVGFFAATSVASSAGALLHGVVPAPLAPAHRLLWRASLVSIGGAALAGWSIGARLALPPTGAATVERLAALWFGGYALVAGTRDLPYRVAIANYLPSAAFLAASMVRASQRPRTDRGARLGLAGLGLTFVAAGVQAGRVGLHPRLLDHNALYHAIQGLAVALFFLSARALLGQADHPRR